MLDSFLKNQNNIAKYYERYVSEKPNKIVLCGLNPGRFGAGLTGVPFIDFKSLSEMIPEVDRQETENSAQFFFEVIKKIGVEKFYENCYVTNVSKFGYSRKSSSKNVNYPELPEIAQNWLFQKFIDEMNLIKPKLIIPLSKNVEGTLKMLSQNQQLNFKIGDRLNHPSWIMIYRQKDENKWIKKYVDRISELS